MIFQIILGVLLLGDLLWGLLSFRALRRRRCPKLAVVAASWAVLQSSLLIFIFGAVRGGWAAWPDQLPRWCHSVLYLWHLLFLLPWLVWSAVKGLSALAMKIARMRKKPEPVPEAGWSRRQFITAAAVFTPPFLSLGGAALAELQLDEFRVRRLVLPIADLPPALEGLTIAQVSDTHVGWFTHGRVLERIVEETNRLDADIVALTGDLINDSLRAMPPALEMARALRARHLVVACEGNHDLIDDPARFYREAERGGFPLLRNDAVTMTFRGQKVQFLGLPWDPSEMKMRVSVQNLLPRRDRSAWPILLAHHPHAWDQASDEAGDIPLTLAGHTHGGLIMLSERVGFGPLFYRYWSGLYRRGKAALVVSNGVGNWFPVRVQAPAEIVHLTLRAMPARPGA